MIALLLIALVILIIGKVKITRRLILTGKPARAYGLLLLATIVPVIKLIGLGLARFAPVPVVESRLILSLITWLLILFYLVLLALPFRDKNSNPTPPPSEPLAD